MFLIAGMRSGRRRSGLIHIEADFGLNQIILLFGASYILFDGGAALRLVLKQVWITIVVIATVGVLITAALPVLPPITCSAFPSIVALLLGATLASTDPATLVPIFRPVRFAIA